MLNNQINQEAEQIKQCCEKIENTTSPQGVRQEVQKIKDCCNKIEQNIK